MNDENEARRKPLRVLFSSAVSGFIGVGAIVYFGADHRNAVAGIAAGVGAGLIFPIIVAQSLWPKGLRASLAEHDAKPAVAIARGHVEVLCLALALAIGIYGIVVGKTGVILAAVPFVVLATVVLMLRNWVNGRDR